MEGSKEEAAVAVAAASPTVEPVEPLSIETAEDTATTAAETTEEDDINVHVVMEDDPSSPVTSLHHFQPGDHVIRWEMLPIAWPIQIHGIVLSVNETALVLVDFGLAAAPQGAAGNDAAPSMAAPISPASPSEATEPPLTEEKEPGGVEEYKEDPEDEQEVSETGEASRATASQEEDGAAGDSAITPTKKKSSWFSSDPKEVELARQEWMEKSSRNSKKILASFQKLHPKKTPKQRLNVVVLEDPSEWKKWKKVNYDKGLFGFGGGNDEDDEDGDDTSASPTGKAKWWKKMSLLKKSSTTAAADDEATDATAVEGDALDGGSVTENGGDGTPQTTKPKWWQLSSSAKAESTTSPKAAEVTDTADFSSKEDTCQTPSSGISGSTKTWWKKMTTSTQAQGTATASGVEATKYDDAASTIVETGAEEVATAEVTEESPGASFSTASMNPAMAKLMEEKREKEAAAKSSTTSGYFFKNGIFPKSSTGAAEDGATEGSSPSTGLLFKNGIFRKKSSIADGGEETSEEQPIKKLDLPKADPPKLVLARTRWLLKHGEAVLPPYHAFHANSECIAVFCKTGYWRNLQADVFLHSTAIGNAKTMGVATMGVAASVPLLAPVIAGLGIGMVAAPWLVLNSAKKQANDITQKMTDQFWAQAEPEVFVECIEHWSKLEEYYKKQTEEKVLKETAATVEGSGSLEKHEEPESTDYSKDDKQEDENPQVVSL